MTTLNCTTHCTTKASAPAMHQSIHSPTCPDIQVPLVVIDRGAEDYQQLVSGVVPGAQVIVLSAAEDGIAQLSWAIAQYAPSTVHLIAHGAPGCLYLGSSELSLDTLGRNATTLAQWFAGVESPNLVIYGCRVAAGDAGEEFVQKLHRITGANVSAATGPVGAASRGGSWALDVHTRHGVGDVSTPSLALTEAAQAEYAGVLGWVVAEKEQSLDVRPGDLPGSPITNDLLSNEEFGASVSIFGEYAVVGIPRDRPVQNNPPNPGPTNNDLATGAVYIYKLNAGNWEQQQRLTVPDNVIEGPNRETENPLTLSYGSAVAMTAIPQAAGDPIYRLVVGDPTGTADANPDNNPGIFDDKVEAGRVYIYDLNPSNGQWELQDRLQGFADLRDTELPESGANESNISLDEFGSAIAVSGDTIVVGAPRADSYDATVPNKSVVEAGAVYIYEKQNDGSWAPATISLNETLVTGEPVNDVERIAFQNQLRKASVGGDLLGTSVAIDNDTVIIGAPGAEAFQTGIPNQATNDQETGAAYVFSKKADGKWSLDAILRAEGALRDTAFVDGETNATTVQDTDLLVNSQFGQSVSISGNYAVVGAYQEDLVDNATLNQEDSGAAYIFEKQADGSWQRIQKLTASDASPIDEFGFSVSISGDFILIGAPLAGDVQDPDTGDELIGSGSSYVFQRNEDTGIWEEVEAITSTELSQSPVGQEPLPFGRPTRENGTGEFIDLDRTFGDSVSIYQDPSTGTPQAIVGAPSDIAILDQDDTSGQIQDPNGVANPAVDGPVATAPDPNGTNRPDVQTAGSVYFLRTRPEVIDVVFREVTANEVIPDKVSPRGPERNEDFFASDADADAGGYTFTIIYNERMDPSATNQPQLTFLDPGTGNNLDVANATGAWTSVNGGIDNAYVVTVPLLDQEVELDNIDLEIRGAKSSGGVEQEDATKLEKEFLADAFDIDTKNPTTQLTLLEPIATQFFNSGRFTTQAVFSEAVTYDTGSLFNVNNFVFDPGNTASPIFSNGSPTGITLSVTPSQEGPVTITIDPGSITDEAGNVNEETLTVIERIYDITPPEVVSLTASTPAGPVTAPINTGFTVTVDFDDNLSPSIADFDDLTDALVVTGNASISNIQPNATDPTVFTFDVTPDPSIAQAEQDITVNIPAGVATDLATNPNTASGDLTVRYDGAPPTVTLTGPVEDPVMTETFVVTATFSEIISDFEVFDATSAPATPADLSITNGTILSVVEIAGPGPGQTYEITIDPDNPGDVTVGVIAGAAFDGPGNANLVSAPLTREYIPDVNEPPVITVAAATANVAGDAELTFSAANTNAISVDDPDVGLTNELLVTVALDDPALGLISLGGTTGLTFVNPSAANDGVDDTTLTFTGNEANVNAALEGLKFTPSNVDATANLSVTVNDQGFTGAPPLDPQEDTETIAIAIQAVANEPPVIALPTPTVALNGDTDLVFSTAGGNAITVADPDVGPNELLVTLALDNPLLGNISLGDTTGLTFVNPSAANDGVDDTTLTFTGTQAAINAALDGLTFEPVNADGTVNLNVTVDDQGFSGPAPLTPESDTDTVAIAITRVATPAAHDFDGNGISDFVWQDGGNSFLWFLDSDAAGTVSLEEQTAPFALPAGLQARGAADFNGDGNTDLVLQDASGNVSFFNTNPVPLGTPRAITGTATAALPQSKGPNWSIAGVGDFGGPVGAGGVAQTDILWRNTATGEVSVWYMNGQTLASDVPVVGPLIRDQNWEIAAVGDFNSDLDADIVWRNQATGQHLIWLMNDNSAIVAGGLPSISPQWTIAGSGDYNGDLNDDLVWRNQATGENAIWLMNGTSLAQRQSIDPLASGAQIVHN